MEFHVAIINLSTTRSIIHGCTIAESAHILLINVPQNISVMIAQQFNNQQQINHMPFFFITHSALLCAVYYFERKSAQLLFGMAVTKQMSIALKPPRI